MTIETSDPNYATGSKASVAADEAQRVGSAAVDATQGVAHEAATQASAVVDEAKDQLSHLVDQTKREVRTQLDARAEQAASGLQTFSRQLTALKEGRPQEAGGVGDVLSDLEQRVQRYAQSVQSRGPSALASDVTAFARRRPMAFLFGAAFAGFAVGRLVRAGAMNGQPSGSNGDTMYGMRRPMDGGLPMQSGMSSYESGTSSYDPMANVRETLPDGGDGGRYGSP